MAIEICDNGKQLPIHQLNKLDVKDVTRSDIYPLSVIQAIFDARTGIRLDSILSAMNFLYLPYAGSSEATRLQIPLQGRHRSFILSYIDYDKNVHIEQYVSDSFTDEQWQCKHNWKTPFTDGNFVVNVDDEKLLELLNNIFNEFKQTPEFINLITEKVRDWLTSSEGLEVIKESITRELDNRNVVYWGEPKKNDSSEEDKYKHNFKGHIRLTDPSSVQYIDYIEIYTTNIEIPIIRLPASDFNADGTLDFTAYAENETIRMHYVVKDAKEYTYKTIVYYPTYDDIHFEVTEDGESRVIIKEVTEEGPYLIDFTLTPVQKIPIINLSLTTLGNVTGRGFFENLDHISIYSDALPEGNRIVHKEDFIFDSDPNDDIEEDPYYETEIGVETNCYIKIIPKVSGTFVSPIEVYYNGNRVPVTRANNTFNFKYKGTDDYYMIYLGSISDPTPPEPEPIAKTVNIWQAVEGEDLTVSVDKIEVRVDTSNTFVQYDKFSYPYDRMYNLTMRSQHNEGDYEWVGWYKNNGVITNVTSISNLSFISSDVTITRESISDEPIITNYVAIIRRKPIEPEPVKHLVYPWFNFNSMEDVNKLDDLIIISDDPSVPEIKADLASIKYSRWDTAISNINEYFTVKFVPKPIGPSRSLTTEVKDYYVMGAEVDKHQKIIRLEQNLYKVEYCGYPNKEYHITMKPFETARDINFVLKIVDGVYGYVRIEYSGITYMECGHEFATMEEKEFSYSFKSVGKRINIITGPVFNTKLKVDSLTLNGKEIDYTLNNSNTEINFNIDLDAETYNYELIISSSN